MSGKFFCKININIQPFIYKKNIKAFVEKKARNHGFTKKQFFS